MSRNRQVVEETVDGVTITKEFDEDRFALPAITYELSSARDDAVRVQLVDDPPPSLEPEQFGFHSDYGSHDWRIDDESLVFERRLSAGENVTTVVGVREVEDTRRLLKDIDEVAVTPADASEETDSASDGRDDSTEEAVTADAVEPSEPTGENGTFGERETDGDAETTASSESGPSAVESTAGKTDSIDARIRHLQADVADLRAYTTALEEFLDEHGSASEVVADFDDRLDAFQDDLDALETQVETNETAIDSVSAEVDEVRETVDDTDTEVDALDKRLQAVEAKLADVGDLSTLADRVTSVEADVEDVNRWRESLRAALATPASDDV